MTNMAYGGDAEHALQWLRGHDNLDRSFAASLDSLRAQQRHLQESLRDGFQSRPEIIEWCHAVDVVSAGQTPTDWHANLVRDRWKMACFVADPDVRDNITDETPDAESTRQRVRRQTVRNVLLPAFQSVLKILRERVGEYTDGKEGGVREAERMQYIAGRPRLHQRAVEQHQLLHTALHNPPRTETEIMDWGEDAIHATEGRTEEGFLEDLLDRHGDWWHALTRGPSVRLEWLLVDDVLPACNVTLSTLAADSDELADTVASDRGVPPG